MSIKTRRILYITFILAFFTIAPLVISYAAGYKLSLSKKSFQKTGMLILNSEPVGAKIYLDEKLQVNFFEKYFQNKKNHIVTPAKIKNLEAGEYNVKLELDGYWEWQKKLAVKEGESTFAEDIFLFKKNLPLLLSEGNFIFSSFSPDKNNLILNNGEKTTMIDLSRGEEQQLPLVKINKKIIWSPDNKKIITDNNILDIKNKNKVIDIANYIETQATNLKWKNNSSDVIIYQNKKESSIKNFSLNTKTEETIIKGNNIIDFLVKNNRLFTINEENGNVSLNIFDIDSKFFLKSFNIPSFATYSFVNQDHKLINIYDERHQVLYIIDPDSYFPLQETINNITTFQWINDNKLLYANNFEIWITDISNHRRDILTRISGPISQVLWHPSQNYVIYLTNDNINIIELDDRERRNITEIIKIERPSGAILNKDGDTLYFNGKIGNQQGIYKLTIQ